MNWAMNDAPTDNPAAMMVLVALANRASTDGTGAFPYVAEVAAVAKISPRTAHRRLDELELAGIIRRGDQDLVSHRPPGYRPVVWDLAMPARAARPANLTYLDDADEAAACYSTDTAGQDTVDTSPDTLAEQPCQSDIPRGAEPVDNPVDNPGQVCQSDTPGMSAVAEGTSLKRELPPNPADAGNQHPGQVRRCAAHRDRLHPPPCRACGTAPRQVNKRAKRDAWPPWCGTCESDDRRYGITVGGALQRCPRCHPHAGEPLSRTAT